MAKWFSNNRSASRNCRRARASLAPTSPTKRSSFSRPPGFRASNRGGLQYWGHLPPMAPSAIANRPLTPGGRGPSALYSPLSRQSNASQRSATAPGRLRLSEAEAISSEVRRVTVLSRALGTDSHGIYQAGFGHTAAVVQNRDPGIRSAPMEM